MTTTGCRRGVHGWRPIRAGRRCGPGRAAPPRPPVPGRQSPADAACASAPDTYPPNAERVAYVPLDSVFPIPPRFLSASTRSIVGAVHRGNDRGGTVALLAAARYSARVLLHQCSRRAQLPGAAQRPLHPGVRGTARSRTSPLNVRRMKSTMPTQDAAAGIIRHGGTVWTLHSATFMELRIFP